MEKIGFIGLGRMGKPMAANLRKRGFELVVMDLNRAAVAELVELGRGITEADIVLDERFGERLALRAQSLTHEDAPLVRGCEV